MGTLNALLAAAGFASLAIPAGAAENNVVDCSQFRGVALLEDQDAIKAARQKVRDFASKRLSATEVKNFFGIFRTTDYLEKAKRHDAALAVLVAVWTCAADERLQSITLEEDAEEPGIYSLLRT